MLNENTDNVDNIKIDFDESDIENEDEYDVVDENKNVDFDKFSKLSTSIKKTIPIITKFETAKLIGIRVQQLAHGATPCVKGTFDSIIDIAETEFKTKQIPLIVRRYLPNGSYEDWKIKDFLNI